VIRRDPRAGGSLARGISGPGPRDSNRLQISQSVIKRLPPQTTKKTMKTKPLQAERQPGPERCPRNIRSEPFDVLLVLDIDFLMFDQIVKLGLNTINFAICPGREYRPKASVMSSLAFGVLCHMTLAATWLSRTCCWRAATLNVRCLAIGSNTLASAQSVRRA
jgi:hypothetical protein